MGIEFRSTRCVLAILLSWSISYWKYVFRAAKTGNGVCDPAEQTVTTESGEGKWLERRGERKFSGPATEN